MADIKRYSVKESLNRIYRLFNGNPSPSDALDSLSGEIYSEDTVWSRIAELFAGSLPGETATLPSAIAVEGTRGSFTASGTFTAEDIIARDAGIFDNILVGTGTLYAGNSRTSIGGFSTPDLFGNGSIVQGFGPASVIPSGTLSHLGGVLYAEGGALKWLGSSGTITTIAGS
jgi:hypothetical protein